MYPRSKFTAHLSTFALTSALFLISPVLNAQSVPDTIFQRNQVIAETLEQVVSSEYADASFASVLGGLREDLGINIQVHESAVDNNLDADTPIVFSLDSVSLSQTLNLMLDPYDCAYTIKDGVLLIVSTDYAIENPMREVIDCSELLQTIQPYTVKRRISPYGGGAFGGGGDGGGVFRVESGSPTVSQQPADQATPDNQASDRAAPSIQYETITVTAAEQLIELLEETIDPDSWESNGGTARVKELNGKLVIVQTARNLREIKDLFESLK